MTLWTSTEVAAVDEDEGPVVPPEGAKEFSVQSFKRMNRPETSGENFSVTLCLSGRIVKWAVVTLEGSGDDGDDKGEEEEVLLLVVVVVRGGWGGL
jgi:hypothetical protein